MKNQSVLVIAPHHDDEIIGCGGTILALKEKGWNIFVQHVFNGSSGIPTYSPEESAKLRTEEAENSAKQGGYKILPNLGQQDRTSNDATEIMLKLVPVFRKVNPDIVFVPHDEEQDYEHRIVAQAGWEASWLSTTSSFLSLGEKPSSPVDLYLGYEVWRPIQLVGAYFDISSFVEKKKELLMAFASQMQSTSWVQGSIGLNAYRGTMLQGKGFVEAFTIRNLGSKHLEKLFS